MKHPRLRDSHRLVTQELYPLNEIPDNVIVDIAGFFAYLLYTGRRDISGADWGDAFAAAIEGQHLDSPVGIADVVKGKMAWSMKTVKAADPMNVRKVRSQFTIHTNIPSNAVRFSLKRPPVIAKNDILSAIGFDPSWVNIIRPY